MYLCGTLTHSLATGEIWQDLKRRCMKAQRDWIIKARENRLDDELTDILDSMLRAIDNDNICMFEYYEWLWHHLPTFLETANKTYFSSDHCKRYSLKLIQIVERIRISAINKRREQSSQRLAQSDLKSIAMDASMPIPPTMTAVRGRLSIYIREA